MKVCVEALTGLVVYTIQTVPTTRCSLEAAPLKMTPTAGAVGRVYILRTGGVRSLRWPRSSPQVGWQSHPLDDPPHPTLPGPLPAPPLPPRLAFEKPGQRDAGGMGSCLYLTPRPFHSHLLAPPTSAQTTLVQLLCSPPAQSQHLPSLSFPLGG